MAEDYLIKLPLPLASNIGMIVSQEEFSTLGSLILALSDMRDQSGQEDHLPDVDKLLKSTVLPLPHKYLYSLPTVIRENIDYFYKLD